MVNRSHRASLSVAAAALVAATPIVAQTPAADSNIIVTGEVQPDTSAMTPVPDVKGVITARTTDRIKVTAADGTSTVVFFNDQTQVQAGGGFLSGKTKLGTDALLNGLPVTVKAMQAGQVLLASKVTFGKGDYKTASMIRQGTAQGFAEQTAATQALKSRVGDIDNYNVKTTTNVYFDTGRWALSDSDKAQLCNTAMQADGMNNAVLLVVGYTDSVGSEDYNQTLSEKRAASVINYLQQACHWKPYRVMTPTGMAEADPAADNATPEGKRQNRRVAVNVLVSKAVDGI